ncbi:MAG TPA: 6,7-dimethyl-8-ribityllumazine synthase [Mycobacteriales bacterium]|nr:6,7-dimethyl-8-ribityllumazine synthase [Mycobacteriales bacterium]
MTGKGLPEEVVADGSGLRVAVVASRWHGEITDALLAGALRGLEAASVADPYVCRVPGAFELAVVTGELARSGYDAVVALGVVVRGGTPHFDYVCSAATDGLNRIALETGVPVGFGLLTCDTTEQAFDRAGLPGSSEDKGREAAMAAVETALVLRGIRRAVSVPGRHGRHGHSSADGR